MARTSLPGLVFLAVAVGTARAGTLEVQVAGVRNSHGDVRVAVCSRQAFLGKDCEHVGHAPAHSGVVTVRIDGVATGVWAVQAFHDENDDHVINRNFLGLPKEGIGFSNDAQFRFGPPRFEDAAVRLGADGGVVRFSLRYFD